MSQQEEDQLGEDQLGEMDVDEEDGLDVIVEMVNGTNRSLIGRYLARALGTWANWALGAGGELEVAEGPEVMEVPEVPDGMEDDITVVDEDEGDLVVELDEDEGLLADMETLELDEYLEMGTRLRR